VIAALPLLAALAFSPQSPAQTALVPPDAFAEFETHFLSNGLKVWYKSLPADPVVSISVALPFGYDSDPLGKEQLAHFTEHMLFADQPGRSEEEIKREIEERGGFYNASVTADRTFYFVRIGKEHAIFALGWLYRIIAPHAMNPDVVERQREPVALEIGARPRQLFDWIWAYYINPPALRLPGFWEREFGIETPASRDYYPYASLYSITAEDLRSFYDAYYVPSLMTLTVAGDLDHEAVFEEINRTFASLPAREEPAPENALRDPKRHRQRIFWVYRPNVYYNDRLKFYGLTGEEEVMLIFISQFLQKRLNDQLRFGERKATYGIRVAIVKRDRAAYLGVSGAIKESEFDFARAVIERELEALRSGTLPEAEFEADRAAVARQLRVANTSSEDLERWVANYFYDPRMYRDFPDLAEAFEIYTKEDVETFVAAHFVPERQVLMIIYRHPITQGLLLLLVIALVWGTVYAARRWLVHPVDMTRIRYVARFHIPRLYLLVSALILFAFVAVAGRLLVFGFQVLADRELVPLESFLVQWSAYAAMLATIVFLAVLALSRIPRKLLVFDDELRIKHLSYRSLPIPAHDVEEISLRSFREVWLSSRIWRCVPLALGLFGPAIYLRRRSGGAYFFNVRDKVELLSLVEETFPAPETGGSAA